jgi:hypothetical protein
MENKMRKFLLLALAILLVGIFSRIISLGEPLFSCNDICAYQYPYPYPYPYPYRSVPARNLLLLKN